MDDFLDWIRGAGKTEKHLQGKHDQGSHGRRGGGSGTAASSAPKAAPKGSGDIDAETKRISDMEAEMAGSGGRYGVDRQVAHMAKVRAGAGTPESGWVKSAYGQSKANLANRDAKGNAAIVHLSRSMREGVYIVTREKVSVNPAGKWLGAEGSQQTTKHRTQEMALDAAHRYLTTPLFTPAGKHPRGE